MTWRNSPRISLLESLYMLALKVTRYTKLRSLPKQHVKILQLRMVLRIWCFMINWMIILFELSFVSFSTYNWFIYFIQHYWLVHAFRRENLHNFKAFNLIFAKSKWTNNNTPTFFNIEFKSVKSIWFPQTFTTIFWDRSFPFLQEFNTIVKVST